MSGTSQPAVPIVPQVGSKDQIMRDAAGFQNAVDMAKITNPAFAKQLIGSSMVFSKTNVGMTIALLVTYFGSRFGFQLDGDATALLVTGIGLAGTYIFRWLTTGPISGWFKVPAMPTDTKAAP